MHREREGGRKGEGALKLLQMCKPTYTTKKIPANSKERKLQETSNKLTPRGDISKAEGGGYYLLQGNPSKVNI